MHLSRDEPSPLTHDYITQWEVLLDLSRDQVSFLTLSSRDTVRKYTWPASSKAKGDEQSGNIGRGAAEASAEPEGHLHFRCAAPTRAASESYDVVLSST